MPDTLKPCPFCGGEVEIHSALNDAAIVFGYCNSCGTEGPWISSGDRSEARAAWNHRAPSPEVERLVEALEKIQQCTVRVECGDFQKGDSGYDCFEVDVIIRATLTACKEAQR